MVCETSILHCLRKITAFAVIHSVATVCLAKPEAVDLGVIRPTESAKAELELINSAGVPLSIDKIDRECGCTNATISKNVLKPGESARILVTISGRGYEEDIETRVVVRGSQGGKAFASAHLLKAKIREIVRFDEDDGVLELGGFQHEKLPAIVTRQFSKGEFPIAWDSVTAEIAPNKGFALKELARDGEKWLLRINIDQSAVMGVRSAGLTLRFLKGGVDVGKIVERVVTADIAGSISASPQSLFFGEIAPGAEVKRLIKIDGEENNHEHVESVVVEGTPSVTARIVRSAEGHQVVETKFRLEGTSRDESHTGEVRIKVKANSGKAYSIIVPFYGTASK